MWVIFSWNRFNALHVDKVSLNRRINKVQTDQFSIIGPVQTDPPWAGVNMRRRLLLDNGINGTERRWGDEGKPQHKGGFYGSELLPRGPVTVLLEVLYKPELLLDLRQIWLWSTGSVGISFLFSGLSLEAGRRPQICLILTSNMGPTWARTEPEPGPDPGLDKKKIWGKTLDLNSTGART